MCEKSYEELKEENEKLKRELKYERDYKDPRNDYIRYPLSGGA